MSNPVLESIVGRQNYYRSVESRFFNTFRIKLGDFWDLKTLPGVAKGFDIIKLFDLMEPGEEESLEEAIMRKHGPDAVQLINDIVSLS